MLIKRTKQQVIIIVSAVVLLAGFAAFQYLPMRKKCDAIQKKHISQSSLISQAGQKDIQLSNLQNKLNELQADLVGFESSLPGDTQLGSFLGKVARLMDEYGLTEQQITPQQETKAGKLNCIGVTMKCRGGLSQVRGFYAAIQQLDRAIRVEEFRLLNDNEFSGQITMETKIIIYYRNGQA